MGLLTEVVSAMNGHEHHQISQWHGQHQGSVGTILPPGSDFPVPPVPTIRSWAEGLRCQVSMPEMRSGTSDGVLPHFSNAQDGKFPSSLL